MHRSVKTILDARARIAAQYDGAIPIAERRAAEHGPRAHERLRIGADMASHRQSARTFAHAIKRFGTGDASFGRMLAHCRFEMAQWRKLRDKRRALERAP